MGVIEMAKFQTVWAPVLKKHFFKLRTQVASEDDLGSKNAKAMTPIKI